MMFGDNYLRVETTLFAFLQILVKNIFEHFHQHVTRLVYIVPI